jgi:hypothetical protein
MQEFLSTTNSVGEMLEKLQKYVSFDLFDLEPGMDERIDIGINGSPVAGTLIVILQDPDQILGIQDMLSVRARP